jgi:hypothetical protein
MTIWWVPGQRYGRAVERELGRLQLAASLVQADLRRTLGGDWVCAIDQDFVLSISDGRDTEASMLSRELQDPAWYVNPDLTDAQQADTLDAEAAEAVADEALEVLEVMGTAWPLCAEQERPMTSCSGEWLCPGKPPHAVALVGDLGVDRTVRRRPARSEVGYVSTKETPGD